jgi:hypothetical protein
MTTTLQDYGRHSEKHGDIGFYYAFTIRFWFGQHELAPNDINTWCRENCKGYYKVSAYTHESSTRLPGQREFSEKVVYVDKIYLSDHNDALKLKEVFDVRDERVKRPRIKRFKIKRGEGSM